MIYNAKKLRLAVFFRISCGVGLMLNTLLGGFVYAEPVQLTPRPHQGSLSRVKTVVELAGSLSLDKVGKKASDEEKLEIPLKVNAELFFDEKGLPGDHSPALRHYWEAKADFEVENIEHHRELREDRQLVLLSTGSSANERYTSPYGALKREEIELLDVASNGFPPERLLPGKTMEVEDTWTHDHDVVAELLRLDAISSGKLVSEVSEITPKMVTIVLSGEVSGKVDGVSTEVEIKGNYQFDRDAKFVKWIALAIREKRDVGLTAPGFNVTTRIRTVRETISNSDALPADVVSGLNLLPADSDKLLDFVAEDGSYQMALDRRWYLLSHQKFASMLRMVDDGDLVATCKIDQLTKTVPGKQVTLDGFREDVQRALDKNCKEIISGSQSVNPQGIRVLRVVATGEVGETPIRWIYYHLSDDEGQRLSYIFTHEASLADRFAGTDEEMTSSVQFLKKPEEQARAKSRTAR